ncbi:MAG TPA: fibronectin type III domain-containing protein [Chloroflexota bacterium]|nr:fibronectin type III domain-containing protein [Chloroflexota bacterium]
MRQQLRAVAVVGAALASSFLLGPWLQRGSQAQTCDVRLGLDTPTEGARVSPHEEIRGWAIDLLADGGTGIDAIVVSLDGPLDSPDNRLIGVADYGSPRPDLVDALGDERFGAAGFSLGWDTSTVGGSGTHQLYVQAHSACGWHTVSRTVTLAGATSPSGPGPAGIGVVLPGAASPSATPSAPRSAATALAVTPTLLTPAPTSPSIRAPENVRLVATSPTSVTLAWDPPPGETPAGYLIYQSTVGPDGANTPGINVARVPGTQTTVTLDGLADPTRYTYFFTVSSLAANGQASTYASSFVTTTPPGTRVPLPAGVAGTGAARPTPAATASVPGAAGCPTPQGPNFVAIACTSGPSTATVTWVPQSDAAAYNVYGMLLTPLAAAGGPASPLTSAAPGSWVMLASGVRGNSATLTNLPPNGAYAFLVRVVNQAGQEAAERSASATLLAAAPVPAGNPTPLLASTPLASPGITPTVLAAVPTPPATAPPATGLITPAAQPTPATLPAVSPGQPLQLTAQATSTGSVVLSWSPVAGANVTYQVLVQRAGMPQVPDPQRGNLTSTSTVIEGVPPGIQFTFQIVARDAQGAEVGRSNQAPVTVPPPGPPGGGPYPTAAVPTPTMYLPTPVVPTGGGTPGTLTLRANPSDPGTANLQWDLLPNAVSYSVWVLRPGAQQWENIEPNTPNAAAFFRGLSPGQYYFQVRGRDASGAEFAPSNVVTVQVN